MPSYKLNIFQKISQSNKTSQQVLVSSPVNSFLRSYVLITDPSYCYSKLCSSALRQRIHIPTLLCRHDTDLNPAFFIPRAKAMPYESDLLWTSQRFLCEWCGCSQEIISTASHGRISISFCSKPKLQITLCRLTKYRFCQTMSRISIHMVSISSRSPKHQMPDENPHDQNARSSFWVHRT